LLEVVSRESTFLAEDQEHLFGLVLAGQASILIS
jgi:hypothetical protein